MTADLLAQAQITIYGDDRLLYSSPTLGLRDEPMAFSVDVSGVKFLKIDAFGKELEGATFTLYQNLECTKPRQPLVAPVSPGQPGTEQQDIIRRI